LIKKVVTKKLSVIKSESNKKTAKKRGLSSKYFFEDRIERQYKKFSEKQEDEELSKSYLNTVEKKNSAKKVKTTWIFLIFNIAVVAGLFIFQFSKEGVKPLSELFAEHPYYRFVFLSLGLFILINIIEVLKFLFLIHNASKKWRLYLAFKIAVYGKYWDYVTPLATGGQPFQIIELRKNKFSGDISTGIPLAKYLFWQIAFLAFSIVVFVTPLKAISTTEANVVKYAALVGFIANAILFLLNLLIGTNKKVGEKIIVGSVKLGAKLKIVKNPASTLEKVAIFVDNYQKCMKNFVSSFKVFIVQTLLAFLGILAQFSIAYSVYLTFNFPDLTVHSWFEIVALALLCEQAISFIPIPGGAAAAEVSFMALFSTLFAARGEGVVFWAMLIWRFCTFYLFIIQGLIVIFVDALIVKRKIKKQRISK